MTCSVTVERRRKSSVLLIVLGLGLLAGALVWIFASLPPRPPVTRPLAQPAARVIQLRYILFLIVVLTLLLGVGLLVILRWSRHFRRMILRRPAAPTPSEDVWAMHRLQEEPGQRSGEPADDASPE